MMIYLSSEKGSVNCPFITFFDFETTTKEPARAEIITGYFKTVECKTRQVIDELNIYMKPIKYIQQSYSIHGISEEMANNFPDKKNGMRLIFRYLQKHKDSLFICHANYSSFGVNGYFDWQVLKTECLYLGVLNYFNDHFRSIDVYSTHTMAKDRKLPVENYKLSTLANYIKFNFNHHNCQDDVNATEALFWHLVDDKNLLNLMGVL